MSLSNVRKAAPLLLVLVFWVMTLPAGAHPTLPQAVTAAHSVFLQNQTGFPELEYTALLELNKWGRFDIVSSQDKLTSFWSSLAARTFVLFPTDNFPAPPV